MTRANFEGFPQISCAHAVLRLYKALGHYPDYWYWKLRGEPMRSPHLLKQRAVRDYAHVMACAFWWKPVRTTARWWPPCGNASRKSIPWNSIHALAQRAAKKFSRWPHIHILEGDSQKKIPEILNRCNQPALFWLDAGYYGWAGLQGDKQRLTVRTGIHPCSDQQLNPARHSDGRCARPQRPERRAHRAASQAAD